MHRHPHSFPAIVFVACAGTQSPQPVASGPALKSFVRNTHPSVRSIFVAEFGDPDNEGALLEAWSPSRDMDKIVAPLFVYAGQNDSRVPRSESDTIVNALRQRKVPVEYMLAANEGHGIDRRENQIELLTRLARFLEDSMGLAAK